MTAAVYRAAHLVFDGEPKIIRDDFAMRFSGADTEASFQASMSAALADLAAKVGPELAPRMLEGGRSTIIMRCRYAEDQLSSALARGITHYVILGAGLDSFAWRRPELGRALQIIEIDNPTTQQWKRRRLEQLGIHKPSNLTFLPIDFERKSLIDGLREGGYPLEKPAFISWLGVTQYLTRNAVLGTLKQVSKLASGTELVFTFIVPERLLDDRERRILSIVKASMSAVGEPWISFFDPDELTSIVKDLGFSQIQSFGGHEANERYFSDRKDGLRVTGVELVMQAQVG
jgi:methyltransferase (TIGR00027 family)